VPFDLKQAHIDLTALILSKESWQTVKSQNKKGQTLSSTALNVFKLLNGRLHQIMYILNLVIIGIMIQAYLQQLKKKR
jgi:hypothetical protein